MEQRVLQAEQAWVFQWNPVEYNTFADYHTLKLTEPWRVNAHWSRMREGDAVLLWKTGAGTGESEGEAGIYAVAVLKNSPWPAPLDDNCKYRVEIEYVSLLSTPILKTEILGNGSLQNLAERITRGTNFQVEEQEWKALKLLLDQPAPKYWLFNVSSDQFPLVWDKCKEFNVAAAQYENGRQGGASVTRNINRMKLIGLNDYIVAYSGNKSILAIGRVTRTFYEETDPRYYMALDGEAWGQRVGVNWFLIREPGKRVTSNFKSFVGIPQDSVMGSYVSFEMSREGFHSVWNLLNEESESGAGTEPAEEGGEGMTEQFINYVRSKGFSFGEELLNTYIVSLRTKPFVILSGISGTGKTKIAQLFAQYMSPTVYLPAESASNDDRSYDSVVKESYHKYNRITIKKQFEDLLDLPSAGSSSDIRVFVEEVCEVCKIYRNYSSAHGAVQIQFKGTVAKTLKERYPIGSWVKISFESDESGDIVRIGKPEQQVHCTENKRFAFLSVRPDWVDNKSLLGYYNPITEEYQATEVLRLLIRAREDKENPYFVIFDEMNLAKVEYYFSDFLSCLESRRIVGQEVRSEPLRLHDHHPIKIEDEEGVEYIIPPTLEIPGNVYFTGTVNIDETTYMFSPKVLDRANVIEFNDVDLDSYRSSFDDIPPGGDTEETADSDFTALFTDNGRYHERLIRKSFIWDTGLETGFGYVKGIHRILQSHQLQFGYRVIDEILFYLINAGELAAMDMVAAMDRQILQRVLPKLHGNRAKIQQPLLDLLAYCCGDPVSSGGSHVSLSDGDRAFLDALAAEGDTAEFEVNSQFKSGQLLFRRSAKKLYAMFLHLEQYGFVSFIE
ncbi:EVE domain-containing protein [Paenibacillus motobuensis]|nr:MULTISPECIES: EVE domain-containing protein [Paenibacillus]MCM3040657.1 EVE domain-containing protein [Paenibacillus lutimineralis]MCM3647761.1 EVE domain-containing protein [Paenibacillus motobuensis]